MISLSIGTLYTLPLEQSFRIAHLAGFKYLEIGLDIEGLNAEICWNAEKIRAFEKKFELKIISFHAIPSRDIDITDYFNRIISFAKEIDVKYIVFHTPKNLRKNCIRWFDNFYLKQIERKDIILLTENMGSNYKYNTLQELQQFPNLVFDTAHALKSGEDVLHMIKNLPNIREFHLSGYKDGSCHQQILNDKKFYTKLLTQFPKPIKCLELCPDSFQDINDEKEIIKELRKNREFLKEIEQTTSELEK